MLKTDWFRQETKISDWRNIGKVDYSTNAIVSQWYSGEHTEYFRFNVEKIKGKWQIKDIKWNKFIERLKDTVIIGIDYYGFNISKPFIGIIDTNIFYNVYYEVLRGDVVKIKVWFDNKIHWSRV